MTKDHSLSSALHLLGGLAFRYPEALSSDMLALSMQTNAGVVRRLLSKLAKAGLVKTQRGQGGGSCLAKPPEQITIREVYKVLGNQPIFRNFDKKPYKICPVSCGMGTALKSVYDGFEKTLFKDMEKTTLADLVNKLK